MDHDFRYDRFAPSRSVSFVFFFVQQDFRSETFSSPSVGDPAGGAKRIGGDGGQSEAPAAAAGTKLGRVGSWIELPWRVSFRDTRDGRKRETGGSFSLVEKSAAVAAGQRMSKY